MHYRREIDGLRAIAVVPVILFHAGFQAFSGGFVGVDVFFVISGYLITGILLAEQEAGTYSLIGFYERRARRILPALFLVLAATLPFAWLWLSPPDLRDFAQSLAAVPVFASNVLFWHQSGYFDAAAEMKPLLHTWSLAVEEQYYLVFPLLLGLGGTLGRRGLVALLSVLGAASLLAAHWGAHNAPAATFFLFPTRFWEILVGSLVAFLATAKARPPSSPAWSEAGSLLGLALIGFSIFAFDGDTPFPSLYALVPTLGTALVIQFATPATVTGRLLGTRPLVGIGLVSFSAYLWHQPLLVFARHRLEDPGPLLLAGLCAAALVLAYGSWRFVEQPFRNRHRTSRQTVARFAGLGAIVFVAAGSIANANKGFESRFGSYAANSERNQMATVANGWCFYSVDTMPQLPVGEAGLRCKLGRKDGPTRALLMGDSFAGQYEPFVHAVGEAAGVQVDAATTNWCYPGSGEEYSGPRSSRALAQCLFNRNYLLAQAARYDVLILGGDWGHLLRQGKLDAVQEFVHQMAPQVPLVVLLPSPTVFDSNVNQQAQLLEEDGRRLRIERVSRRRDAPAAAANEELRRLAHAHANVLFLDRGVLFRAGGRASDVTDEGKPFSFDGAHISIYGARKAAEEYLRSQEFADLRSRLQSIGPGRAWPARHAAP